MLLQEFFIAEEDILTSSIDHGPDVKKASAALSRFSEWCLRHMTNCCLVDATGFTEHKNQSRHPIMREFISNFRSFIESHNKSVSAKLAVQREAERLNYGKITLHNSPSHHWSAIIDPVKVCISDSATNASIPQVHSFSC